jgi:hypothetical protein
LRDEEETKPIQSSRDLGGGEIFVSEMKRISGERSLISLLKVRTAAGLASPLQFQDKSFIAAGEA